MDAVPLPLKEINVDIKIIGFVAEVTSSLLYTNKEENPVEAAFTFPIDDDSAVFSFEAVIDGRHIVAEIQETEQAKLTYEDAIQKGSTAMLLKEDDKTGDIFQCTLGNLLPHTDARITFSYVIELPQEPDGKIRFTLPTVLNPRYSPDVGGVVAAEGATYTSPEAIPYQFSMNANVRGRNKVMSVTSQVDKLTVVESDDKSTSVTLAEEFKFDHDISFLVEYENSDRPQAILEKGNPEADGILKEDVLMINFYPQLHENASAMAGEYIFVIDRSGSMGGDRIKNAKEALFLFLKSLPAGCYFNVVSFGSSFSCLFESKSSEYTQRSLILAQQLQKSMDADMGGTEIYTPLQHIFSKRPVQGGQRQVFLLTDGEVSNTDQLIGLVKSNAHNTRVFTLGIGSGVSSSLIKGVARAGNGKAEFIADKDRIQPKVISLLQCATQPSISDLELQWNLPNKVTAVSIPENPPRFMTAGERLCMYALVKGGADQPESQNASVTLKGHCDGNPISYKTKFPLSSNAEVYKSKSAPLHRLAAKSQIKILETEEAGSEDAGGRDNDSLNKLRQDMILLSTSANIISRMTAFVAVDKDAKKPVEGEMVKRPCPVPVATSEFNNGLMNRDHLQFASRYRCMAYSAPRMYMNSCDSLSADVKLMAAPPQIGCPAALDKPSKISDEKRDAKACYGKGNTSIADIISLFCSLTDSLKLEINEVGQLQPYIKELMDALSRLSILPPDFEGKEKVKTWSDKLSNMAASDELDDNQMQQMLGDLESTFTAFNRFLQNH